MLKMFKDKLYHLWQGRFQYGISIALGSFGFNRHKAGVVIAGHGPMIISPGTQHWPWYLFEFGVAIGSPPSWHVGVLGLTVGMLVCHDHDDEGVLLGPDYHKYYWFFKGLNHQQKDLEEII